jgi:hypothetical protein
MNGEEHHIGFHDTDSEGFVADWAFHEVEDEFETTDEEFTSGDEGLLHDTYQADNAYQLQQPGQQQPHDPDWQQTHQQQQQQHHHHHHQQQQEGAWDDVQNQVTQGQMTLEASDIPEPHAEAAAGAAAAGDPEHPDEGQGQPRTMTTALFPQYIRGLVRRHLQPAPAPHDAPTSRQRLLRQATDEGDNTAGDGSSIATRSSNSSQEHEEDSNMDEAEGQQATAGCGDLAA